MTTQKNTSIGIVLLGIFIVISSFGNEVSAQESKRLFLHPDESSDAKVNESDGAVKHDAAIDKVHIASYDKNDKLITYSVQRQWIYGWNKQPAGHHSGEIDSGASLRLQEDKDTNGVGDNDTTDKMPHGNTSDHLIETQYAYNKYFASIASDYHLMDNGDDTISDSTLDLTWSHIDSDSASSRKNALAWEEEKNDDGPANKEWILPETRKLKRILDFSLFPDTTGSAESDAMFNATSLLKTVNQNDYTDSVFKTGRPFINSAYFSSLAAEKTEQEYYWERYIYNDATSYNQMDSAYNVKIFTIDTQGNIKDITGKILNLFL